MEDADEFITPNKQDGIQYKLACIADSEQLHCVAVCLLEVLSAHTLSDNGHSRNGKCGDGGNRKIGQGAGRRVGGDLIGAEA